MALNRVDPFCYWTYHVKTGGFAHWMTDFVETNSIHGLNGWIDWFTKSTKCLNGEPAWKTSAVKRAQYHNKLRSILNKSDSDLINVINEIIVDWHGMPESSSYPSKFAPEIRKALNILLHEGNSAWNPNDLITGGTIASLSKVYQLIDPHKWTIYDSRLATGLACLVRHYWNHSGIEKYSDLIRFPVPDRHIKGWKRPAGFPSCSWSHQACLGFVYASWLLRQIAEIMRSNSK